MNDYLSTLVIRTMQPAETLQPRVGGMFEPVGNDIDVTGDTRGIKEREAPEGVAAPDVPRGDALWRLDQLLHGGSYMAGKIDGGMRDAQPVQGMQRTPEISGEMGVKGAGDPQRENHHTPSRDEYHDDADRDSHGALRETRDDVSASMHGSGAAPGIRGEGDGIVGVPGRSGRHRPVRVDAPEREEMPSSDGGVIAAGPKGSRDAEIEGTTAPRARAISRGSLQQGAARPEPEGTSIAKRPTIEPKVPGSSHLHPTPSLIPRMESVREERPEPRTIRVTIGRIEVRAIMPREPVRGESAAPPAAPRLSLDDYLKAQKRGYR